VKHLYNNGVEICALVLPRAGQCAAAPVNVV
jgi:hypothetical protein